MITWDGKVYCWGQNNKGQLGDGTTSQSNVPVDIGLPAQSIVAGAMHTCAIVNGSAVCWGNNDHGEIGDGTKTNRKSPVYVSLLGSDIVELAAGAAHTCALTSSGAVYCWGQNDKGQLGTLLNLDSSLPQLALLPGPAVAVTAAGKHTCAAMASGGVTCWGENDSGQLGIGVTSDHSSPVAVSGLTDPVVSIDTGAESTCATFADGSLKCWGDSSTLTPGTVISSGVQSVSVGNGQTCVTVLPNGVECWGDDGQGQLGNGEPRHDSSSPVTVAPLPGDVIEIEAGAQHVCSLHASGAVYCWGQNNHGQLGMGSNGGYSASPVVAVSGS